MNSSNFRYCCGIVELGHFGWGRVRDGVQEGCTAQNVRELLREARERNKGYALCTTVSQQTAAVKVLKQAGFEVLNKFRNPNTGATVTLWGRGTVVRGPRRG